MIKRLVFGVFIVTILSCNNDPRAKLPATGNFGATVTEDSVKTVNDVMVITQTASTDFPVKVTGIIEEYCKGEGCWLTLENKAGSPLFVEVENKAFILPHNINGKVAVVDGIAIQQKDAEKTEWKILAKGVLIK